MSAGETYSRKQPAIFFNRFKHNIMKRTFKSIFSASLIALLFAASPVFATGTPANDPEVAPQSDGSPEALHCKVERPDGTILSCWFCKCSDLNGMEQQEQAPDEDAGA